MRSSFITTVWFLAQPTTTWSSYDLVWFCLVLVINDVTALAIDNLRRVYLEARTRQLLSVRVFLCLFFACFKTLFLPID